MATPTSVTVELDWSTLLHRFTGYNPETDQEFSEPTTIEDLIVERAARIVAAAATRDDSYRPLHKQAREAMESVIQEKAAAAVERVFAEPRQPTDQWGNPKGEPVTMAEQVQKLVEEALSKVSGGDSFSRESRGTIVQQTVAKLVKETVQKEVKAAVDAERDAIVAKVAASSAAVLTEGLKRAVKA